MIALETVWIVTALCESRTALAVADIVFRREPGKELSDYLRSL